MITCFRIVHVLDEECEVFLFTHSYRVFATILCLIFDKSFTKNLNRQTSHREPEAEPKPDFLCLQRTRTEPSTSDTSNKGSLPSLASVSSDQPSHASPGPRYAVRPRSRLAAIRHPTRLCTRPKRECADRRRVCSGGVLPDGPTTVSI